MGKYEPLTDHLRSREGTTWTASFAEIECILGFPLPISARNYREWWANQRGAGHSQKKGWQDAGWQVWKVDLAGEMVTFRNPRDAISAQGLDSEEALIERAGELLGTADRGEILREALHGLIQRESARRLARLGGSMPEFQAPPRRRFGG
jgi:hypothetical protein